MIALFQKPFPTNIEIIVDNRPVSVTVKVSARARHYRLAIPHGRGPVLTIPKGGRWPEAAAFLHRQNNWLAVRLKRTISPVQFIDGAIVPLRGVEHVVRGSGQIRGQVTTGFEASELVLIVPGAPEHRARRLTDWLKSEAQRDLEHRVAFHAARLGVRAKSIRMRTQSSRWGSCSSSGRLNFNWKLILAPAFVLDYVAAHEVAHLVEMNHSAAFWHTVEKTLPDMARGRAWLKAHGRHIMAYGAE